MGDMGAGVVAKTKGVKVVDRKESRTSEATNSGGFESSVVRAARNVAKGRNEFGRTAERSVFDKQIGEAVAATSLEVGGVVDGRSGGTRSSMAFDERPRTMLVKAVDEDVGG